MIGVPIAPRRVFGVRFSGCDDAGSRTWVCRAHPGAGGVRVERVARLAELPGGVAEREPALRVLLGKILEAPRSAWGFDFPFGLPRGVDARPGDGGGSSRLRDSPDSLTRPEAPQLAAWDDMLRSVGRLSEPRQLAGLFSGSDTAGDRGSSLPLRRTDVELGTESPLGASRAPATFHGLNGLVAPLHGHASVAVLPFEPLPMITDGMPGPMRARASSIYVLEVGPWGAPGGATSRDKGSSRAPDGSASSGREESSDSSDRPGGEGAQESAPAERREQLRRLIDTHQLRPMPRAVRAPVLEHAAAFEALLCAVAAWHGYRDYDHNSLCRDDHYGREGHAYV